MTLLQHREAVFEDMFLMYFSDFKNAFLCVFWQLDVSKSP